MADVAKRPPGRPQSETSRVAILEATLELLGEQGYSGITIDAIAARGRVGRQTIYRRWPTKADVVLELVAGRSDFAVPAPDTGSYRTDLETFLRSAFASASDPRTADLLRGLMTEAQLREEFGARFRATFLQPRREAFERIVDRAVDRGELPSHPAADVVADIVFGAFWYRLLATGAPLDDHLAGELVDTFAPVVGSGGVIPSN